MCLVYIVTIVFNVILNQWVKVAFTFLQPYLSMNVLLYKYNHKIDPGRVQRPAGARHSYFIAHMDCLSNCDQS